MVEFSNGESLPPQEKIVNVQHWDSGYKVVALKTLEKVMTRKISLAHPESSKETVRNQVLEKREKLRVWLDAIDNEVVDNFGVFESQENPGVRFPYAKVLLRNVASSVQNSPINPETEEAPDKIVVVFTPFTPPPGGAPDDTMNIIYDRVLTALPEAAERKDRPAKNITVYGLGLPTSKWGSVSDEWVSDLKKDGFSEYGKLYAEFLRKVFSQYLEGFLDKTNITFYSGSMGTILADQTARQLPEIWNKWNSLRLLLNNPAGVHKPPFITVKSIPLSVRGLQVVGGFGAEAGIRMLADYIVRTVMSGAKSAREELGGILEKKGIVSYESEEQNRLKKSANRQTTRFLIKGTPLDTENFRSHIEQGMLDPATADPKKIFFLMTHGKDKRFFKAGNRSLGMGVNYSHWMDPGRWPDKWVPGIESYEKAVDAQMRAY
jgi:hypothetical protein